MTAAEALPSPPDAGPSAASEAMRTASLRAHYEAGLRAHGDLGLPWEDFAGSVWAHAERRVRREGGPEGGDPTSDAVRAAIPRLAGADLYLATACDAYRESAWRLLDADLVPRLAALARSRGVPAGTASDAADDLRQDLALAAPGGAARTLIGTYDGTGSLFAWLATILLRRLWKRKATTKAAAGGDEDDGCGPALPAPAASADPVSVLLDSEQAARFRAAFAAAWERCTRNERMAILGSHRHGLHHREIATLLGVGRPRVTRLIASGVARLRDGVVAAFDRERPAGQRAWRALEDAIGDFLARAAPLEGGATPTGGDDRGRSGHRLD